MQPDGSFDIVRIGMPASWSRDLYHFLLTSRWRTFFVVLIFVYLCSNLIFAGLYALDAAGVSNARSFWDLYFFAVQTMSTVGYGAMVPQSPWAHAVMVLQSVYGFVLTAISTGLVFAKFSRVRARVLFSREALIHIQDGRPVLTFRAANQRSSHILDATLSLTLVRDEISLEGQRLRRFYTLPLLRDASPLFALVWNIYHVIDENSPLWGATQASLQEGYASLLITFHGIDDGLSQSLHTRHAYNFGDIRFGRRFCDIIGQSPDGRRSIDYTRFHESDELTLPLPWEAAGNTSPQA